MFTCPDCGELLYYPPKPSYHQDFVLEDVLIVDAEKFSNVVHIVGALQPGGPGTTHIPTSQIRDFLGSRNRPKRMKNGARGNLVISLWLAEQRGWAPWTPKADPSPAPETAQQADS